MSRIAEWFTPNRIIILALFALVVLANCTIGRSYAAAVAVASDKSGIRITLYNEPCGVAAVANLPYRATWEEKGKVIEGCAGAFPEAGAVLAYFADKTVVLMPMQIFSPVQSM